MSGTIRVSLAVLAIGLIAAVLLGAIGGYVLGSARSNAVSHIGVVVGSGDNGISVEADGWTYSVPLDVAWIDATGSLHDVGRPECLPSGAGPIEVRFHSVDDLSVAGSRSRQVVMVDCR